MEQVGYTDRGDAMGRPWPSPLTACKGRCEGMGVYPMDFDEYSTLERPLPVFPQKTVDDDMNDAGYEPWPPPDGTVMVECPDCHGRGRWNESLALDLIASYLHEVSWIGWATYYEARNGFMVDGNPLERTLSAIKQLPMFARFMHHEQSAARRYYRYWAGRRGR